MYTTNDINPLWRVCNRNGSGIGYAARISLIISHNLQRASKKAETKDQRVSSPPRRGFSSFASDTRLGLRVLHEDAQQNLDNLRIPGRILDAESYPKYSCRRSNTTKIIRISTIHIEFISIAYFSYLLCSLLIMHTIVFAYTVNTRF